MFNKPRKEDIRMQTTTQFNPIFYIHRLQKWNVQKAEKGNISECKIQSSWIWLSTSAFSKNLLKKWKGNIAIPKSLNFSKLKANIPPAQLAILVRWTNAHLALQLVNPVNLHTYTWNSESQQTTKKTNPFMKLLPILGTKKQNLFLFQGVRKTAGFFSALVLESGSGKWDTKNHQPEIWINHKILHHYFIETYQCLLCSIKILGFFFFSLFIFFFLGLCCLK